MAARVPFDPFGALLEGYRLADADNKQDLSFNAALEGAWLGNDAKHVQNLFNYDTYGGAKQMFMNQAEQSARNNAIQNAMHPGNFAGASMYSADKGLGWSTYQALMAQIEANKRNAAKTALDVSNINLGFARPIAQQTGDNTVFGLKSVIPSYNEQLEYDRKLREYTLATLGGYQPTPAGVDLGLPSDQSVGLGAQLDYRTAHTGGVDNSLGAWFNPTRMFGGGSNTLNAGVIPRAATNQPGAMVAPATTQPAAIPVAQPVGVAPQSTVYNSLGGGDTGAYLGASNYGMRGDFVPYTGRTQIGAAPKKPPANQGFNLQEWLHNATNPTISYEQAVLAAQQQKAATLAKQQQEAANQNGNGIWRDSYFNTIPR
jgi:hypothetical protein